ncbi:MAG: hypothetical protein AAF940_06490 [Pseudomonadota bacterium]
MRWILLNLWIICAFWSPASANETVSKAPLTAGYTFSDEKGGFRIVHASGLGTRTDPIVLQFLIESVAPSTLVIRATRPINPFAHPRTHATGTLHFDIRATNETGQPWVATEFELQEKLRQPSEFGDGLSFDQRRESEGIFGADVYANHRLDFEPYDRLLFEDGVVDPRATGRFSLLVTDLTPTEEFFLQFDPHVPAM